VDHSAGPGLQRFIGPGLGLQRLLAATDGPTCLARYAAVGRELGERTALLLAAILAAAGNPDIQALAATTEQQRAQARPDNNRWVNNGLSRPRTPKAVTSRKVKLSPAAR